MLEPAIGDRTPCVGAAAEVERKWPEPAQIATQLSEPFVGQRLFAGLDPGAPIVEGDAGRRFITAPFDGAAELLDALRESLLKLLPRLLASVPPTGNRAGCDDDQQR